MASGLIGSSRYNQRQYNAGEDVAPPVPGALQVVDGYLIVNPRPLVEVSLDDPGTWTDWVDISSRVISPGIQTNRGRNSELERFQPGVANLQLQNHDGYFGPHGRLAVNLVSNPSVEVDLIGYSGNNSAIARSVQGDVDAIGIQGSWGIECITTNAADSGIEYGDETLLPVTPGIPYAASWHARRDSAGSSSMELLIVWFDVDDVIAGFDETVFDLDLTTHARFQVVGVAPDDADHARIYLQTRVADGVFTFYADALQFEVTLTPSVNLLANPSLEDDETGYEVTGSSTVVRSNAAGVPHSGLYGALVTTANLQYSGVKYDPAESFLVTPGEDYVFSAWARLVMAGSKAMGIWISWFDTANNSLADDLQTFTLTSTTYARFSVTATAPALADHVQLYVITDAVVGIFDYTVDALQFELGTTPSDYVDGDPANMLSDYCDGDQTNGIWMGTPHASQSTIGDEYSPNQRPMNRLRIIPEWDDIEYPMFDGFVDDWTPEFPGPNESIINLTVTDALGVFAIQTLEDQPDLGVWGLLVSTTNVVDSGANYGGPSALPVVEGQSYIAKCSAALVIQSTKAFEFLIVWFDATGTITGFAEALVSLNSEAFGRFTVTGTAPTGSTYAKVSFHTKVADGVFDYYWDALHMANVDTPNDNLIANPGVEIDTTGFGALSSTIARVALPPLIEERSDVRIARALDEVDWPLTSRDLGVGASYLLPQQALGGSSLLAYLQLIEATENGRLWVDKSGNVKFLGRWDLGQAPYTESVATFGQDDDDLKYANIVVSQDLTYVRNEIRLTGIMEGAAEQVAQDTTSIARYFTRAMVETGLLVTDNELHDAAAYKLARYAASKLRFLTLELAPGLLDPVTQWPVVLGLEVSDRVTVKFTPPGQTVWIEQPCFIEGIRHNWTRQSYWSTTLALSSYGIGYEIYPAGRSFFTLGISPLGGNGVLVY